VLLRVKREVYILEELVSNQFDGSCPEYVASQLVDVGVVHAVYY